MADTEPVVRATAEPITAVIANRVRWFRERSGLSQAELAQRMTELGTPWKRATVVNLEKRGAASRKRGNGAGRDSVTTQELLALSLVLDVPLTALLIDERAGAAHLAHGREYTPAEALLWLTAYRHLPGAPNYARYLAPIVVDTGPWATAAHPIRLARQQQEAIDLALSAREDFLTATEKDYEPAIKPIAEVYESRLRDLSAVIKSLRAAGMVPLPVDDRLQHDAEQRGIRLSVEPPSEN